jgi:predicted MFS family arabinose efflux permease
LQRVDCITTVKAGSRFAGLWRHPDFLKLWAGQTISEVGSRITRDGLPLAAVLVLNAKPSQMGFMTAVGAAAVLLMGLAAGGWADRMRRRPILIAADLARAALLVSIPVAAFLHRLSMAQLYVVTALAGFCTVFFDVAYQTYVPHLVERPNLLEANGKLAMSSAAAEIAGPGLTGVLVQLITAPIAILFDALSFLVSAASVWLIRKPEPAPTPPPEHDIQQETVAGLRFIFRHPMLRPLACFSATTFFFFGLIGPLYVLYTIRDLHFPPALLGVLIALGGVGSMLGATLAPMAARRFGLGRTLIGSIVIVIACYAMLPLAHGTVAVAAMFVAVQQLGGDTAFTAFNINELTLRQTVAPDHLLGRVNGAMQLLTRGIYPIGAVVCGLISERAGVRGTIAIAMIGIAVSSLWLIASPLRRLRTLPDPTPVRGPSPSVRI